MLKSFARSLKDRASLTTLAQVMPLPSDNPPPEVLGPNGEVYDKLPDDWAAKLPHLKDGDLVKVNGLNGRTIYYQKRS